MAAETMTPEARAAHNDYMKKWRARNRDKVKTYEARHWQRVADAEQAAAEHDDQDGDE